MARVHKALFELGSTRPLHLCADLSTARRLYLTCKQAGLLEGQEINATDGPSIERLHQLFDVALQNNLASYICHYVQEVCLDNNVVSSTEEQSVLLEGRAVSSWVERAYSKVESFASRVQDGQYEDVDDMERLLGSLNGLALVCEALQAGETGALNVSAMILDERTGEQLHVTASKILRGIQYVEVSLWYGHHRQELAEYEGRGRSQTKSRWLQRAEWEASLERRRELCQGAGLFLDDMLDTLREGQNDGESSSWPQYPPREMRVSDMIEELYLYGVLDERALQAKHAVLLYFLLDLGIDRKSDLLKGLVHTLQLPQSFWFDCSIYFLLDSEETEDVNMAATLLPLIANPDTPAKVAQVLAFRGRADAALLVLRASGDNGDSVTSRGEATTSMIVRLQCGLLLEAFLYQRRHCASIDDASERAEVQTKLIRILVESCLCERTMLDPLMHLPFASIEETLLLNCLEDIARGNPFGLAGDVAVAYCIQRELYSRARNLHEALLVKERAAMQDAAGRERTDETSSQDMALRQERTARRQALVACSAQIASVPALDGSEGDMQAAWTQGAAQPVQTTGGKVARVTRSLLTMVVPGNDRAQEANPTTPSGPSTRARTLQATWTSPESVSPLTPFAPGSELRLGLRPSVYGAALPTPSTGPALFRPSPSPSPFVSAKPLSTPFSNHNGANVFSYSPGLASFAGNHKRIAPSPGVRKTPLSRTHLTAHTADQTRAQQAIDFAVPPHASMMEDL